MIYLSSFLLSERTLRNPNIYPYNVFRGKYLAPFIFAPITILYGNNGCGKSTVLNIIADKLGIEGRERYFYGSRYMDMFVEECKFGLGEDEDGRAVSVPEGSRYIKSEDILFEIKKIQQEEALEQGYIYEQVHRGKSKEQAKSELYGHVGLDTRMEILHFAQEKYSNGETAMQILTDSMLPDHLYLLDEPEVSLSPANQIRLAEKINELSRFLDTQFIIATHSPFLLGTLQGKIYDLDQPDMPEKLWTELENVQFFYEFFKNHEREFARHKGEK